MPTFPKGHHAHQTRLANARALARLTTTPEPDHHIHTTFEFPNPIDLRGIPAIGRSVAGHIAGTQPEHAATR